MNKLIQSETDKCSIYIYIYMYINIVLKMRQLKLHLLLHGVSLSVGEHLKGLQDVTSLPS